MQDTAFLTLSSEPGAVDFFSSFSRSALVLVELGLHRRKRKKEEKNQQHQAHIFYLSKILIYHHQYLLPEEPIQLRRLHE